MSRKVAATIYILEKNPMYFFKPITIQTGWCQAQDAAKIYSGKEGGRYVKLFIWMQKH